MDVLIISIIVFACFFWLHRRDRKRAYAAGRADERADQAMRERFGLAELPEMDSSYPVSHNEVEL